MEKNELLTKGVEQIIGKDELTKILRSGKKMRIKHGVDPTSADLHLGYAVVYHKLKEFQDLGHTIIFLIGDFTGRFGDPTQKAETRTIRDKNDVKELAKNYLKQVGTILDLEKTEIRYNSEWYDKMSAEELLKLMSNFTHAGMIERDMFQERIKKNHEIWLHELAYPVLQGYDSVALKSDLTVIGSDQLFNEMQGRKLQEKAGQKPQMILTVPMLVGTDGKQKMSQSLGNYIGLTEDPKNMFGKTMSIPDEAIVNYYELAARASREKIADIEKKLKSGENPKEIKEELASDIVKLYYGDTVAIKTKEEFDSVFSKGEIPDNIIEKKLENRQRNIVDLLVELELASSKSEARRLIAQGGVKIDQSKIIDPSTRISTHSGTIIQVGKLKYIKII